MNTPQTIFGYIESPPGDRIDQASTYRTVPVSFESLSAMKPVGNQPELIPATLEKLRRAKKLVRRSKSSLG